MKIEIFAICDAATDYGGRLNILGAFEGIASPQEPVIGERCSVATRMRFSSAEEGEHSISVRFIDQDGAAVIPEMNANFPVKMPPGRESMALNLVLNIARIQFNRFGEYEINLFVDGEQKGSLPLTIAQGRRMDIPPPPEN